MTNRPRAIGTATETAFVKHARLNGFGGAERLSLHGTLDEGDVTLCPGLMAELKGGKAAEQASDTQVAAWLVETEKERRNRGADVALLVLKRKGKGAASAGQWWALLPGRTFAHLAIDASGCGRPPIISLELPAVRMTLDDALTLLRRSGYGDAYSYGPDGDPLHDDDWDCGSGMCDPNTGCPECNDSDRTWVKRK